MAVSKKLFKLKLNFHITKTEIKVAPNNKRIALIICTQVVAIMPPNVTYKIIRIPTI